MRTAAARSRRASAPPSSRRENVPAAPALPAGRSIHPRSPRCGTQSDTSPPPAARTRNSPAVSPAPRDPPPASADTSENPRKARTVSDSRKSKRPPASSPAAPRARAKDAPRAAPPSWAPGPASGRFAAPPQPPASSTQRCVSIPSEGATRQESRAGLGGALAIESDEIRAGSVRGQLADDLRNLAPHG